MVDLMLLVWVWTTVGCIAIYAHGDSLTEEVTLLTMLLLVLTWPWWLSHHRAGERSDRPAELVPIRIHVRDKNKRER
jgi:membrane protein implicated in regulation of membrane protease activity